MLVLMFSRPLLKASEAAPRSGVPLTNVSTFSKSSLVFKSLVIALTKLGKVNENVPYLSKQKWCMVMLRNDDIYI